ncbi:uncharacterized protein LOC143353007 [Halictus rubicundus]|uniref:uncharacterized protein LOC143353007 n=1 Tax=Halictus rubicundus TaxID=77578 RepID=UPI004036BD8A
MRFRSTISQSIKYGLRIVGAWPGTPFPGFRKFLWILFTVIPLVYQYMYVIRHFHSERLPQLFDCFVVIILYILMLVKLVVVSVNHGRLVALITMSRSVLRDILTSMEEDCVKYSVDDSKKLISNAADLCQLVTRTIIIVFAVNTVFYAVTTLTAQHSNESIPRRLLLNMDLPFDTVDSPNYELVVTLQFISCMATSYAYSTFTALFLMLVLHTGCHIDILCDAMTKIASSKDEKHLRFVAVRHQELILFAERIEELFTFISLAQLMSNTIVLCCLGYLVVIGLRTGSEFALLVKFAFSYVAICMEIFICCFAGEYLNVKNDMIVETAYQISWYNLQPSTSRQVILLLLRSQKGLQLTFGKFSALSLDTFTSIMKASASYMSVFLAMSEIKTVTSIFCEMIFRSTVSESIKYGLHIVGALPSAKLPVYNKFFWMTCTAISLFYQYMYVITHFYSEGLPKLFDCFTLIFTYFLLFLKLTVVSLNRGWFHPGRLVTLITMSHSVLRDILTSMEEDSVKYSVDDSKNLISNAADLSQSVSRTVIIIYVASAGFYAATTLAAPHSNDTIPRRLLLNMDLPFDTIESPNYELVVMLQIISILMTSYAYSIFSALLLMMIVHMGCQIDILCLSMSKISSSKDEKQFRFVAVRHQELIAFSERIEKLFTFISFGQLISNTIVSCCLGYLVIVTIEDGSEFSQQIKFIVCYLAICIEIFTYCFAGEYLNVKNDMIVEAAYQISWYNLQPSMSRQVILLLLRSQKGLRLTFGKFSALSLETFTWIMKASASYMSVFLAMS